MAREKIEMILKIHHACTSPLYAVLDSIPDEQVNWHPAPESRSISEIVRHLIRIDNSFLKKLNQHPETEDPMNGTASEILSALRRVHSQFREVVNNCTDDSYIYIKSSLPDASDTDTINEYMLHSCQHNLYHLAQLIYLRRAQDRKWKSPIDEWDKATRIIAYYITQ